MSEKCITVAQAKEQLRLAVKQYFAKDAQGVYRLERRRARPVCLMGPAGVGKTELVRQVAREEDLAFLSYSITHHTRQSLLGLPSLREEVVDGERVSTTRYTVSEVIAAIWREMERTGKREGILFLDEFNAASATLHPVMLELLQNKTLGTHAIPDGWMLVAAGNPGAYNRSAEGLDAVTADRLRMLWLRADLKDWRAYMVPRGVHPAVLSYLECHPEDLCFYGKEEGFAAVVTPRAWEDLSLQLHFYEEQGAKVDQTVVGQVLQCERIARQFMTYYRKGNQALLNRTVKLLDRGESLEPVWAQLRELPDQDAWALTARLVREVQRLCREGWDRTEELDQLHPAVKEALASGDCMAELRRRAEDSPAYVRDFILEYLEHCGEDEDGEQLRQAFRDGPLAGRNGAVDRACAFLERSVAFCKQCFSGRPQLDYLLEGVTRDPVCQKVISLRETPQFNRAGKAFYGKQPKAPARRAV